MTHANAQRWTLVLLAVTCAAVLAWAERYRIEEWNDRPVRIHRVTGTVEWLTLDGWTDFRANDEFESEGTAQEKRPIRPMTRARIRLLRAGNEAQAEQIDSLTAVIDSIRSEP